MNEFEMKIGLNKKDAFEGWFCKIDDPINSVMFSIILGYSTSQKSKHAFIQFQDNIRNETAYISYPIEELRWKEYPFKLKIGKNYLTKDGIYLDFMMNNIPVKGYLRFSGFETINKCILKPNIMGWLTYFPNECNHAIISMKHKVSGNILLGNKQWKIENANGYMEKDWGTSFPKEYVWVQANDWDESSVVFSYATVPVLGKYAKGFFIVLHHKGKEYRLTSIEFSKIIKFSVSPNAFSAIIRKNNIIIKIRAKQFNPVSLASPNKGEMNSKIKESLDGKIELVLKKDNKTIAKLSSNKASIDVQY